MTETAATEWARSLRSIQNQNDALISSDLSALPVDWRGQSPETRAEPHFNPGHTEWNHSLSPTVEQLRLPPEAQRQCRGQT
jgi:hypothetical protein